MTREEIKIMLPIMQAFAEGKTIQYNFNEGWRDVNIENLLGDISKYRIKPEPKYRPFKNKEECWNEMLKHQPFGWLINRDAQYINPLSIGDGKDFVNWFNLYTFADGEPFGINEE